MKYLCLFFAWAISPIGGVAQLPTKGLVAHYKFNREKDSTKVYDASSNGNHGSMVGDVTYTVDRFGVGCSAMWFGGNGFVNVLSSNSLKKPQNEFTASVWFKLAQGAHFFKEWITICCKADQSDEGPESPQYRMQATAQTVSINTEFTENFIPQLKYEQWYFYAYSYDGSKVRVYLDGRFVFEYDYTGILVPNDMPLEIGRDLPGALEYFHGTMDDLRIYDRGLDENELRELYDDRTGENDRDRCQQAMAPPPSPPVPAPQPTPQNPSSTSTQQTSSSTTSLPQPPLPPVTSIDSFQNLPSDIEGTPVNYQKVVRVKSREVKIYPYDNDKEDGDIVSININGVWVRDNYEIKNKKTSPSSRVYIRCSLNPGDYNYFVSKACNLGSIPPNTLTIEVDDGTSVQTIQLNSKIGLSGGIKIICEK